MNRVCHVWCNFLPGYPCQTTVNFVTLKDRSLEINILALDNCFSYRNFFQNGVSALSKTVLKTPVFCQKAQNFVQFRPYNCVQISLVDLCGTIFFFFFFFLRNVWRDFKISITVFSNGSRGKF